MGTCGQTDIRKDGRTNRRTDTMKLMGVFRGYARKRLEMNERYFLYHILVLFMSPCLSVFLQ